ncbi:hypothetical protein EGR_02508 [Echinococcus granulosus]|uniref:Uncharacterized protein n=1 Tax=Echinococcus granulosus TaxID=6210 RepID=W6UW85_ECHGR|nr:hypothetical protein EGR_02508 [Echinococcus granulosus]EUB62712.1 hypothetical protein EGR_02508 [Echinococcus granulosus]
MSLPVISFDREALSENRGKVISLLSMQQLNTIMHNHNHEPVPVVQLRLCSNQPQRYQLRSGNKEFFYPTFLVLTGQSFQIMTD